MKVFLATFLASILFSTLPATHADDTQSDTLRKHGVKVERLPDGRSRLGRVIINGKKRSVQLDAKVNMQEGLVELLVCTPDGKAHESVLVADIRPLHLQLALLALGLGPGRNPGVPRDPEDSRRPGDRVTIEVSWTEGGKAHTVRAEEMIWNEPRKRTMQKTDWVFLGSVVGKGGFAADVTGSLITTYHDPLAILECPLKAVMDDTLYFANRRIVPPVGTKVTVTIVAMGGKKP
ncbi:MAG: hypothetical protein GXP25_06070 [Planctomycetes bacterium]|nr:hypothetical protein [Planctomycetota bacterium]